MKKKVSWMLLFSLIGTSLLAKTPVAFADLYKYTANYLSFFLGVFSFL